MSLNVFVDVFHTGLSKQCSYRDGVPVMHVTIEFENFIPGRAEPINIELSTVIVCYTVLLRSSCSIYHVIDLLCFDHIFDPFTFGYAIFWKFMCV